MAKKDTTGTKTPGEQFTVEQVAEALKKGAGYVSYAARILKCRHETVREYMKRYPELAELVQEFKTADIDTTEIALQKKVKAGDNTAIIFKLKCQAKDRGYIDNPMAMHLHGQVDPDVQPRRPPRETAVRLQQSRSESP